MEQLVSMSQKGLTSTRDEKSQASASALNLSFGPPELMGRAQLREKLATASLVLGCMSLVTWVVILFGIVSAVLGIVFSVFGIKSVKARRARIGLGLSVAGLLAALLYAAALAYGKIPSSLLVSHFSVSRLLALAFNR